MHKKNLRCASPQQSLRISPDQSPVLVNIVMNNNTLYEGLTAEQYVDPEIRAKITEDYHARWSVQVIPATNPQLFDPLTPPQGWRYDPYYAIWITHD